MESVCICRILMVHKKEKKFFAFSEHKLFKAVYLKCSEEKGKLNRMC